MSNETTPLWCGCRLDGAAVSGSSSAARDEAVAEVKKNARITNGHAKRLPTGGRDVGNQIASGDLLVLLDAVRRERPVNAQKRVTSAVKRVVKRSKQSALSVTRVLA